MSDLEAGAGGGLELGPISIKAIVDLQAGVASLAKTFSDWKQQEADYEAGVIETIIQGSGIAATSTDLPLDCGGPNAGRLWEVRRIAVGAPNPETAVAGIAYAYVQANCPSPTVPSLVTWYDWTGYSGSSTFNTELPSVAFYSAGQIVVRWPEHLWIVINSGTNLQQYAVGGRAFDMPDRRRRIVSNI